MEIKKREHEECKESEGGKALLFYNNLRANLFK